MAGSDSESLSVSSTRKRPQALELGPRKRSCVPLVFLFGQISQPDLFYFIRVRRTSDPLVSTGRHFCRTVFAMCHPVALLTNGQARDVELLEKTLEDFSAKSVIVQLHCKISALTTWNTIGNVWNMQFILSCYAWFRDLKSV